MKLGETLLEGRQVFTRVDPQYGFFLLVRNRQMQQFAVTEALSKCSFDGPEAFRRFGMSGCQPMPDESLVGYHRRRRSGCRVGRTQRREHQAAGSQPAQNLTAGHWHAICHHVPC